MLASSLEPAPPAGGAPSDQVAIVLAFTALVYGGLVWVMWRERTGRRTLIGRAADRVGAWDRSPRWFALPLAVQVAGALSGATGLYWDVSYHISLGRDEGPLANPAHYFIFLGLIAIFAGAALAMCLADDRLPRRTLRISRTWRVPIGPAISAGVALAALAGFPLDDVWHRLFGQDVTEWGPTHVVMIGGVLMLPYTMVLTCAEAGQVAASRSRACIEWVAVVVFLAAPVAFLLEFAYGVPQFPLLNDPLVLAVATVVTFGLAAQRGARWVATVWLGYAALEAGLLAMNAWVFDALTPWPPLMLGGALVAGVLARWARPGYAFGLLGGVAMTWGLLLGEFFWTATTRPVPWPAAMMPWAVLYCSLAGGGTGLVVVWMNRRLQTVARSTAAETTRLEAKASGERPVKGKPLPALIGAALVVGVFVVNVPPKDDGSAAATVAIDETSGGGDNREGFLEVRMDPAGSVANAYWFEALSWQGGGAVHGELEEVRPGVWRTDEPMPLHGSWKTMVRLHLPEHTLLAAPVYLPADPAIPAEAVPAVDGAQREFVEERLILRREERHDVPAWLWGAAYLVTGALFFGLFVIVAVGYAVAGRAATGGGGTGRPRRTRVGGLVGERG